MIAIIYPTMSRKAPPNKNNQSGYNTYHVPDAIPNAGAYINLFNHHSNFYHPCFTEAKTKL